MEELDRKWNRLLDILRGYGSAAAAFSGGVDSTLLVCAASEALGERMAAVTAVSPAFPEREQQEAREFCRSRGIRQVFCDTSELQMECFRENPRNRCYLCKKQLFGVIGRTARENGLEVICEGSHVDDLGAYRPGMKALQELGVRSPLREAGLGKAEIRALLRRLGVPSADKPSCACLATRFEYGEEITEEKLLRADRAEQLLQDLGFTQVRVRVHGRLARIEVLPEEIAKLAEPGPRERICEAFSRLGFLYTAADLAGYQSGSMDRK